MARKTALSQQFRSSETTIWLIFFSSFSDTVPCLKLNAFAAASRWQRCENGNGMMMSPCIHDFYVPCWIYSIIWTTGGSWWPGAPYRRVSKILQKCSRTTPKEVRFWSAPSTPPARLFGRKALRRECLGSFQKRTQHTPLERFGSTPKEFFHSTQWREREWEDSRELETSSRSWTAAQRSIQTILIGIGVD